MIVLFIILDKPFYLVDALVERRKLSYGESLTSVADNVGGRIAEES